MEDTKEQSSDVTTMVPMEHHPTVRVEVSELEPEVGGGLVETPQQFELMKERNRAEFGGLFRGEADFELFLMLPISKQQRATLLHRMKQDNQLKPVLIHGPETIPEAVD